MSHKSRAKSIVDSIKASPLVKAGKPASERHLARAEKELGVRFPGLYRALLGIAGQITFEDPRFEDLACGLFGLGPSAERWDGYAGITVADLTRMAREQLRLPGHLIAISHDCHDDYHCLDTSRLRQGDCPIVLFDIDTARSRRKRPRLIARGLGAWLLWRVDQAQQLKAKMEADIKPAKPARRTTKKAARRGAKRS